MLGFGNRLSTKENGALLVNCGIGQDPSATPSLERVLSSYTGFRTTFGLFKASSQMSHPDTNRAPTSELELRRAAAFKTLCEQDWLAPRWSQRELVSLLELHCNPLDYFRAEGYWCPLELTDYNESEWLLPSPQANTWTEAEVQEFVLLLDRAEAKLQRLKLKRAFMGHSTCRLCGCKNGSEEYYIEGWKWPFGLRHYLVDHRVRPTKDFQVFVQEFNDRLSNRVCKSPRGDC